MSFVVETWLSVRQHRCFHVRTVPAEVASAVKQEVFDKSQKYGLTRRLPPFLFFLPCPLRPFSSSLPRLTMRHATQPSCAFRSSFDFVESTIMFVHSLALMVFGAMPWVQAVVYFDTLACLRLLTRCATRRVVINVCETTVVGSVGRRGAVGGPGRQRAVAIGGLHRHRRVILDAHPPAL